MIGRSRASDAVGGTGLTVVREGRVDVLTVWTGEGTGVLVDDLVVLSRGNVCAALTVRES